MLTQNQELKADGIWTWTIPAWVTRLPDGRAINVCPQAGACVKVCYARNGTFNFPVVKAKHQANLAMIVDDLGGWTTAMLDELTRKRYQPSGTPRLPDLPRGHLAAEVAALLDAGAACVRIHDSGDFLSDEYLLAWLTVAQLTPNVLFYAYTKEVSRFRRVAADAAPPNFLWVYSLGGREDHLLDLTVDRHADVFPDAAAIEAAGYYDQTANDLLCVVAPSHRIGIPANNIPAFRKRMAGRTFAEMEADTTRHRDGRAPVMVGVGSAQGRLF